MATYNGIIIIQDPVFTECDSVLSTDSCLSDMGAATSKGFHCHIVYRPICNPSHRSLGVRRC